jgi:O-methyltransferase
VKYAHITTHIFGCFSKTLQGHHRPLRDTQLLDFSPVVNSADARQFDAAHPFVLLRDVAICEEEQQTPRQSDDAEHIEHHPPAIPNHDRHSQRKGAAPRRLALWVTPCTKPRSWRGNHNCIARVAVGNAPRVTHAEQEAEKKILGVLDEMVKSHRTYLCVPMQDGKALRLLTEAANAKNVLEIGTSTGYSGLWFCLALQKTSGHLTTFEIGRQRVSMAREHFKQAGVEKIVTVVEGDAPEQVAKLIKDRSISPLLTRTRATISTI